MAIEKFKYHLRPGFNSGELLVEFIQEIDYSSFELLVLYAIRDIHPELQKHDDIWQNDEHLFTFKSDDGKFFISVSNYGFVFIEAPENQSCILEIDRLLQADHRFEKIEVDFEKYKKPTTGKQTTVVPQRTNKSRRNTLKKLVFFWLTSFICATSGYSLMRSLVPEMHVFAHVYRMMPYHEKYPFLYMAIPCFFYGLIATKFSRSFANSGILKQVWLTIVIITMTMLISSPFGGMLWMIHDMMAGFFPKMWMQKMISGGIIDGPITGFYIIICSIPYNIIGSILCYLITWRGARIDKKD